MLEHMRSVHRSFYKQNIVALSTKAMQSILGVTLHLLLRKGCK